MAIFFYAFYFSLFFFFAFSPTPLVFTVQPVHHAFANVGYARENGAPT